MNKKPLTNKEVAAIKKLKRAIPQGVVAGACFMNAQRMAMSAWKFDLELLYHEGFFKRMRTPTDIIKHAWNSLNGKLVDVSSHTPLGQQYLALESATQIILVSNVSVFRQSMEKVLRDFAAREAAGEPRRTVAE